jgi:ABC-type nitrate/sulfonate/bicarbonate transport system permease component
MSWGRQTFRLDLVLLSILCIGLIGWGLDALLERTERRLASWRPEGGFR